MPYGQNSDAMLRSMSSMGRALVLDLSSTHTILVPSSSVTHAKSVPAKMVTQQSAPPQVPEASSPLPQEIEVDTAAITGPILEAIAASKANGSHRLSGDGMQPHPP